MIRPALLTAALAALAATPGAQQKPAPAPQTPPVSQTPPVFKTGVDLVQIDVVVLDADNEPVRGLTKDDFTLFDRGIKQEVATFAAKSHPSLPPDPFAAPLPADVADNQSARSDRLVMIILDDLHFRGRTAEAVGLVERTVNELGDSVSMGLVTTSGTFGIEPTEDRARLLMAVQHFLDRFDPARAKIPQVTSGPPAFFLPPPGTPFEKGGEPKFFRYSGEDLPSAFSPLHTYKTVEDVARMVGANDGRRKAFVWISAGTAAGMHGNLNFIESCRNLKSNRTDMPASPIDQISMQACGMYEKLFRSSVAVYSVSPGGPIDGGGVRALRDITSETGGFSISANDLDEGMYRLLADLDNYYLLGFYPAEPGRTGYRDVDVVVNRPDVTVRHRAGYHSAGPVPPPKNKNPLDALVATVSPKTDLHLRMSAVPFFTKGSSMQILTTIEIDIGELPAAGADGLVRDSLQFAVYAVDLEKKKVTRAVGRKMLLDWPEDHRKPGAQRFLAQTVLNVPPGAYQLRASTTSKTPERSGSVYLQVDVPPKPEEGAIALSGVLLGSAADDGPKLVESKPLAGVTVPFAPSLDREFASSGELRVFFQVYRRNPRDVADGEAVLMTPEGVTAARLPWRLEPAGAGTVNLSLPLASVPAGPYRLIVSGTSGTDVAAKREVRIRVR